MNYIEKLMQDNDIEVNEEFYIIGDCDGFSKIEQDKFYFNENIELIKKEPCEVVYDGTLGCLMRGELEIEKITHKPKTVWDLKIGDEYYYINCYEEIERTHYDGCEEDVDIIECGNAFLTEEEAKFEVERKKCEAILLKYGTRDMMSLGHDSTNKYSIIYDNYHTAIDIVYKQFVQNQGTIYFKSEELAQKAIEEVGEERMKKYIFNVKE